MRKIFGLGLLFQNGTITYYRRTLYKGAIEAPYLDCGAVAGKYNSLECSWKF